MKRIALLGLDLYGCKEALERLDDYLDRELSAEEQHKVQVHLRICRNCALKFAFEADLVEQFRSRALTVLPSTELEPLRTRLDALIQAETGTESPANGDHS